MPTTESPTFTIEPRRRSFGVDFLIIDNGRVSGRNTPWIVTVRESTSGAQVSWPSTSDDRVELAEAFADTLRQACDAARELDEGGDCKAAPKLDGARTMLDAVLADKAHPNYDEARSALATIEDPDTTAERLEALCNRWSW